VHVVARIGHGRTEAQRKSAGEQMFAAVSTHLDPLFATRPLALSLEIQELDPVLNFKRNNLHERLAAKRGSAA
jgi:5-carboxymethyl-2-hydroxymuconate isomerase